MAQPEWATRFLDALAECPNVSAAAKAAGVGRSTVYDLRSADPDFAKAWDDAIGESTDNLVGEAYRRAFRGTDKPVYQQGSLVGTIREYSDTLTIFLLKSHRPEVYADRAKTNDLAEALLNAIHRANTHEPDQPPGLADTEVPT